MPEFTHIDEKGKVKMVDVGKKPETSREAIADGWIFMSGDTIAKISTQSIKKGNVFETARIAGIMAAKNTSLLIPMCHPLPLNHVDIDIFADQSKNAIKITAKAACIARTGIEMEALTAVSISLLTIYDMCKSYDKNMRITDISLKQKTGGKSGKYLRCGHE